MRIKSSVSGVNRYLFTKRSVCGYDNFWSVHLDWIGRPVLEMCENSSGLNYSTLSGNVSVTDGVWHNITFVRENGVTRYYLDGILRASGTANANINNNYMAAIGAGPCPGLFTGEMDELRVFNRALCGGEILSNAHCNLSAPYQGLALRSSFDQGFAGGNNTAITHVADQSGNNNSLRLYYFERTGTASNFTEGSTSTTCVAFSPTPVSIGASSSLDVCQGQSVSLFSTVPTGAYNNQWFLNGSPISGATGATYQTSQAGNYSLQQSINGCQSTSNTLIFNPKPLPVLTTFSNSPVNYGGTINLNASGANTYSWSGPASFTASGASVSVSNAQLNNAGTYTVSGTTNGCTSTSQLNVIVNPKPAVALNFDGVNDFVEANNFSFASLPFTFEASVRPALRAEGALNYPANVLANTANGTSGYGFGVNVFASGNQLSILHPQGIRYVNNVAGLNANQWCHVAVAYSVGNVKTYVNGNLIDDFSFALQTPASAALLWIGKANNDASTWANRRFFAGDIDEVRIWNRLLCGPEINASRSCQRNGTGASLMANYSFNQGFVNSNNTTVNSLIDQSSGAKNGTLNGFSLQGLASNWVDASGNPSGSCAAFALPEINITGNNISIPSGSVNPLAANFTLYNQIPVGSTETQTFVIRNEGNATLTIQSIQSSSALFVLPSNTFPLTIAAGASFNLAIRFEPNAIATAQTDITITSDDCDEANYTFRLQGDGVCAQPTLQCLSSQSVNAVAGTCLATINYNTNAGGFPLPQLSYQFSGATTGSGSGTGTGSNLNVGTTQIIITATNTCGTRSCTSTVEVKDNVRPIAKAKDITIYLNGSGNASLSAAMINDGSSDLCSPITMTIDQASFNCAQVGNRNVVLRVTDSWGNVATDTALVTIADSTKPVITCPSNITVTAQGNACQAVVNVTAPVVTDNCSQLSLGNALAFDGVNDVVFVDNRSVINSQANSRRTVEAWFRVVNKNINTRKQVIWEEGGQQNGISIYVFDGKLYAGAYSLDNQWTGNWINTAAIQSGQWHNVALVLDATLGSNQLKLYLDGVLVGQTFGKTIAAHPLKNAIGGLNENGYFHDGQVILSEGHFFHGEIDEIRHWTTARTSQQLADNVYKQLVGNEPGLILYYNFDQGVACGNNTTVTILDDKTSTNLNGTLTRFALNGSCNSNWTYGAPVLNSTITLTNSYTNSASASSTYPVGVTPITWVARDQNNNTATCVQTITVNDLTKPVVIAKDITVSITQGGEISLTPQMIDNGSFDSCGSISLSVSPNMLSCNQVGAHIVVLTGTDQSGNISTDTAIVTLNAQPVLSIQAASPILAGDTLRLNANLMGSYQWSGPNGFSANLQNPFVFPATLANSGAYTLNFTHANGCTATAQTEVLVNLPASALNFDGVNDHILVNASNTSNMQQSVEAWVNWQADTNTGFAEIWSKNLLYSFSINKANGKLRVVFGNGSSWGSVIESTLPVPQNQWVHVAFTRSASAQIFLYINGVASSPFGNHFTGTNTQSAAIGFMPGTSQANSYFKGSIGELRVWNKTLCQGEINYYQSGFPSMNPSGLVHRFTFDTGFVLRNNQAVNTLKDQVSGTNASLQNFALNGQNSNWVQGNVVNNIAGAYQFPQVSISTNSPLTACGGSTIPLVATYNANYQYTWGRTNTINLNAADTNIYLATVAGDYFVDASVDGCVTRSASLPVRISNPSMFVAQESPRTHCQTANGQVRFAQTNNNGNYSRNVAQVSYPIASTLVQKGDSLVFNVNEVNVRSMKLMSDLLLAPEDDSCNKNFVIPTLIGSVQISFYDDKGVLLLSSTSNTDAQVCSTSVGQSFYPTYHYSYANKNLKNSVFTNWPSGSSATGGGIYKLAKISIKVLSGSISLPANGLSMEYTYSTPMLRFESLNNQPLSGINNQIPIGLTHTGLDSGNYTYLVTDGLGCEYGPFNYRVAFIPDTAQITTIQVTNANCPTNSLGTLILSAVGGNAPHSLWNTVTRQTITNALPGTYLVAARSNSGCLTATRTVNIGVNPDNSPPFVMSKPATILLNALGQATLTTNHVVQTAIDNCAMGSVTLSKTQFTCADLGSNTVNIIAVDHVGNTRTVSANVEVVDIVEPLVTTQSATIYLDALGKAQINEANVIAQSSDNCAINFRGLSQKIFTCENLGANTINVTVKDASGNQTVTPAQVIVRDTILPTLSCKADTIILDSTGFASTSAARLITSVGDNCGINDTIISRTVFNSSQAGLNQVIITLTDKAGNSSTCTTSVYVIEPAPVAQCKNAVAYLNENGLATLNVNDIDNGSYSLIGLASRTLDKYQFSCFDVPATQVALTVTSTFGKSATCQALVTVYDTLAPVVNTQDINVYLNASGEASITPAMINQNSSDACGIDSLWLNTTQFNCNAVGVNQVILSARDVNGNVAEALALVTVYDTLAPVVNTQDINVYLNASGEARITPAMINQNSSDACGIDSLWLNTTQFTCNAVGVNQVVLSARDVNGNVASKIALVAVIDSVKPIVVTKNLTVTLGSNGQATITPLAVNNGSSDACGIAGYELSKTSFSCNNIGQNMVTLKVTDNHGNFAFGSAQVTVVGVLPSCSITAAPRLNGTVIGSATTLAASNQMYLGYGAQSMNLNCVASGVGPFTYQWSGTGLSQTNIANPIFTPTAGGNYTLTCTVTNSYGCVSTCSITLCVIDVRAPGNGKVYVCHVPPGNPNNRQTLSVSINAVPAHVGQHGGDKLGTCSQVCGSQKSTESELAGELLEMGEMDLVVYPNPSNARFNFRIEGATEEPIEIFVTDMNGKEVVYLSNVQPNEEISVDLGNLSNGIYHAVVRQGEITKSVKLSKIN